MRGPRVAQVGGDVVAEEAATTGKPLFPAFPWPAKTTLSLITIR